MDEIMAGINWHLVDPYILGTNASEISSDYGECRWSASYSLTRQFFVLWGFLYAGAVLFYFLGAFTTYALFYQEDKRRVKSNENPNGNAAYWKVDKVQVSQEIFTSVWSLGVMSAGVVPVELLTMCGYGKVYFNVSDYGWGYLLLSPILFLIYTDTLIYWIHRGLHWGPFYFLHKLHHKYKETTPFSAFSFHPVDGYLQGLPYHLFVLCFPMHSYLYAATLAMVGLWTVNIHDRVTLRLWGVNGAAHHTIHHTKFNYNYGQYFTFWDHVFGTFKDPYVTHPYTETGIFGQPLLPAKKLD